MSGRVLQGFYRDSDPVTMADSGFRLVRRALRDSEWERDGTVIWVVDTGLTIIMIQLEVVVRVRVAWLQF
jgi:hypothetical protein